MRFTQTRNFPTGSIIIRPKTLTNVEIGICQTPKGRFEVKAYSGKRNRPDMYYSYRSQAERDASVARYMENLAASARFKTEQAAKRVLKENPVKVGDILVSSWGYDQTNVSFFQVVAVKGVTASIREIGSKMVEGGQASGMSSNVVAVPDAFTSEVMNKRIQTWDGGRSVSIKVANNYAHLWDGKPCYSSWYA